MYCVVSAHQVQRSVVRGGVWIATFPDPGVTDCAFLWVKNYEMHIFADQLSVTAKTHE